MELETTPRFEVDFAGLSVVDRRRVEAALARLLENPRLPGLRFRKLAGQRDGQGRDIWYFRASDSLRITCVVERDVIYLRRVGQHDVERNP